MPHSDWLFLKRRKQALGKRAAAETEPVARILPKERSWTGREGGGLFRASSVLLPLGKPRASLPPQTAPAAPTKPRARTWFSSAPPPHFPLAEAAKRFPPGRPRKCPAEGRGCPVFNSKACLIRLPDPVQFSSPAYIYIYIKLYTHTHTHTQTIQRAIDQGTFNL